MEMIARLSRSILESELFAIFSMADRYNFASPFSIAGLYQLFVSVQIWFGPFTVVQVLLVVGNPRPFDRRLIETIIGKHPRAN